MDMNKPQFLSRAVLGKVLLIMAGLSCLCAVRQSR